MRSLKRFLFSFNFDTRQSERAWVVTYSGWNSRRVRTSHSLVASLGGQRVIAKRRQLTNGQ